MNIQTKVYFDIMHFYDYKSYTLPDNSKYYSSLSGKNEKAVLVCISGVSDPNEDLVFLKKVIGACGLDAEKDTHILILNTTDPFSFNEWKKTNKVDKLIVFGMPPEQLGLFFQCSVYHPITVNNCTFLFCENIHKIRPNEVAKRNLWNAMKNLFQIA